jgi:hypothetical protein
MVDTSFQQQKQPPKQPPMKQPPPSPPSSSTSSSSYSKENGTCRRRLLPRRRHRHHDQSNGVCGVVSVEEFLSIDTPHPYGVLPGGNRFFLSRRRPSISRDGDLSSSESTTTTPIHRIHRGEQDILSDALWQHVLSYCTATALAQVVQSSRYFYVAGHQPELWRDLVLRYCHTHGNLVLDEQVVVGGGTCWKDTYILLLLQQQQQQQQQRR